MMIALKRILVATDFGPAAEAALTYGRALAKNFGATLTVMHVAENFFLRATIADPHALKAAVARRLEERLTAEDRRALHARAVLETSDQPADAIITYAKQAEIDLIVMGTHGRHGISHLLVGSVAEHVVRTASCPVLTVKHPEHEFVIPDAAGPQQEARPS
jgi:nucleotide-binding universal stress UspA family protein